MHRAGGVGGDELDIVALACADIGAAVFGVRHSGAHNAGEPVLRKEQVDEAGTGDLKPVEQAAVQRKLGGDSLGDLARCLVEGAGTGHGRIGGNVAVFDIGGDLHDEIGQLGLRQRAVSDSSLDGIGQQGAGLRQRRRAGVVVFIFHDEPPVGDFYFTLPAIYRP